MKNLILATLIAILFTIFVGFKANPITKENKTNTQQDVTEIIIVDSIQEILDKSCLPCHGIDGKGKAKMKWNFAKMPELSTTKQVSKLSKIVTVLEKDKMPTAKFIKKYPERRLTADEKQALIDWADGMAKSLVE